ncbi:MAG: desulfoferrodoxin [Eubacterium sp.]|nr:desulfoferrodoxin [Candidatus Colimonas fimequi]
MKFYVCEQCGNFVGMINESGVSMMCCGHPMTEVVPGTTDGALEKHVPVINVEGNLVTVKVGEVEHPMEDVHYIQWIALETDKGAQRKALIPGEKPCAKFTLTDGDEVVAAYAYCNLHGLWKETYHG